MDNSDGLRQLHHFLRHSLHRNLLIGYEAPVANLPFPLTVGNDVDLTHLHKRVRETIEELLLVGGEQVHDLLRLGVAREVLVRGENTLLVQQVDVVHVVELGRGAHVQVHSVRGLGRGTRCHQVVLEVRVNGWVRFDCSVD